MSSIMAIGAGLVSGRTDTANEFTVYTQRSGFGGLSVGVDGPSKADIRYTDNHDGTVKVIYTPYTPGEYKVIVRYDGINVKGSPYTVRIRGDDSLGHYSRLATPSSADRAFDRSAYGTSTSSRYGGSSLSTPSYGGNPGRVRVYGHGLYSGIKNTQNEIEIDVRDAGSGRLHWSIEGPGHVESKNRGLENGIYKLWYRPDAAGEYQIKIKYSDVDVYGSPYRVRIV
ncbi:Filamin-A [Halotydeus destructor]|nr:Filamin-A [Halotydeus destructor]